MPNAQIFIDRGTGLEDLSRTVVSVTISRGRTDETEPFQTGRATINLRNLDGSYDPGIDGFTLRDTVNVYVGGGLFGTWSEQVGTWDTIDPSITWLGPEVFAGFIEDVVLNYDLNGDAEVQVSALDGLALLANQQIVDEAVVVEQSGNRISAVLGNSGVSWPNGTAIDTGISQLAAGTATGNALTYMRQVEESEQGYLYVAANGVLTFRSRDTVLNEPLGAAQFADDGTGLPYSSIQRFSGARSLFNRVTGELEDGTTRTVDDVTSQSEFSIRALELGTVLLNSADVLEDFVDYLLSRFRQPTTRVEELTVILNRLSTSEVNQVAAIDLVDSVDIRFTPPGASLLETKGLVQGIRHNVTVGLPWRTTLIFEPRDTRGFLILDSVTNGILDDNVLGF
jgi:hypothetical protein